MVWNEMKYGMERKFRYGIWKMPEWNGRFQEWNGRQSFILPYQFHTRFGALYSQKNTYRCRVVIKNIVTKVFNSNIYAYCLSSNRGTLVVYIAQTVLVLHQCKYIDCNLQHWCYNWRLCQVWLVFFFCFFLRLTIHQDLNFVFLHRHENSYLLFRYRFGLILFIFLIFQLTVILFGVKAWYFYYGKCSLAVWLWQTL